jgi:hypothetical protein
MAADHHVPREADGALKSTEPVQPLRPCSRLRGEGRYATGVPEALVAAGSHATRRMRGGGDAAGGAEVSERS